MNPEIFLVQSDIAPLVRALNQFALKVSDSGDRQDVLEAAGIEISSLSNLKFNTTAIIFAQALVATFRNYQPSSKRLNYHPMVNLLNYLATLAPIYELSDQDLKLFTHLVERGHENFNALLCRNAVGRIESPQNVGIGTGVLIGRDLLLTCDHIFTKTQVKQAWVRFGYKCKSYGLEDIFELSLEFITHHRQSDYALLKIKGIPSVQFITPASVILSRRDKVRAIHHPQGKPVVISTLGQILQVGEDYVDHNINTCEGSSGAPIFNCSWDLVALHQGIPGIGRNTVKGASGGIPIQAIWQHISPYIDTVV